MAAKSQCLWQCLALRWVSWVIAVMSCLKDIGFRCAVQTVAVGRAKQFSGLRFRNALVQCTERLIDIGFGDIERRRHANHVSVEPALAH